MSEGQKKTKRKCSWCRIGFGPGETPVSENNPAVVDVYHAVCIKKLRRAENRLARKILKAIDAAVFRRPKR